MRKHLAASSSQKPLVMDGYYARILTGAIYPHHFLTWWQIFRLLEYLQLLPAPQCQTAAFCLRPG